MVVVPTTDIGMERDRFSTFDGREGDQTAEQKEEE